MSFVFDPLQDPLPTARDTIALKGGILCENALLLAHALLAAHRKIDQLHNTLEGKPKQDFDIDAWCEEIISGTGGFSSTKASDIVKWVLRCLGDIQCEGSDKVLAAIARHRHGID